MRLRTRAARLATVVSVTATLLVPASSAAIANVQPDGFTVDIEGVLITCTDASGSLYTPAAWCGAALPGPLPDDSSVGASVGEFRLAQMWSQIPLVRPMGACEARPHTYSIEQPVGAILLPAVPCGVIVAGSLAPNNDALTCARHRASGGTGTLTIGRQGDEQEQYTITDFGWTASRVLTLEPIKFGSTANARQVRGRFTRSSDGRTGDVNGIMLVSHNGAYLWHPVYCSSRSIYHVHTHLIFTYDA